MQLRDHSAAAVNGLYRRTSDELLSTLTRYEGITNNRLVITHALNVPSVSYTGIWSIRSNLVRSFPFSLFFCGCCVLKSIRRFLSLLLSVACATS
jgi:hypothetical protein